MIAAQDTFFAAKALDDAMAMAHEFSRAMSEVEGMSVHRKPSEVSIAGRLFSRVDYSGVGLFRSTLHSHIRCHFVSFNLTANDSNLLANLVLSLNNLADAGGRGAANPDPMCKKNHVGKENLLTKVDPAAIGPSFTPIPVRIIIGADGSVKHVHVIRATAEQRRSIETALGKWKFKPQEMDGRSAEIETGLLIEFMPAGTIKYSGVDL